MSTPQHRASGSPQSRRMRRTAALDRRRDILRHRLTVLTVLLLIIDIIGLIGFHAHTVSDIMEDTAVADEEYSGNSAKHTVPAPQEDAVTVTLSNLRSVDGDARLAGAGFTLSQADEDAINQQLAAFMGAGYSATFVVADLNTGAVLSSGGNTVKYSASAIKGPYVVSLAATNTIDLDHVTNQTDAAAAQDYHDITQAIQVSDNTAYADLFHRYSAKPIQDWLADSGVQHNLTEHAYLDLSAIDLAIMWTKVYQYVFTNVTDTQGKASVDARNWFVSNYANSLESSITAALGANNHIMSKAGWIDEAGYVAFNDGGIVFPTDSPVDVGSAEPVSERPDAYVIVMMTDAYEQNAMLSALASTLASVYANSMSQSADKHISWSTNNNEGVEMVTDASSQN